ncbi:MAG: hypothetical protein HY457_03160 [Parcubacteria group bacterium]|nr:hypothetical protein [Parcubacteria group bacterium]
MQPFDPNYLNIEYFFNLLIYLFEEAYRLLLLLLEWLARTDFTLFRIFSWLVTALIVYLIGYAIYKHRKLDEAMEEKYGEVQIKYLERQSLADRNLKWHRVLDYCDSQSESDWRLAIMEADTMLDEVLDTAGYVGDTLGEKLKRSVVGDFKTLNEAWEAHKVRNQIAHEGANFQLTKRETERVINLYRKVFEEFHFV